MATVGRLNVILTASTAKFASGLARAARRLASFAGKAAAVGGGISAALGGVGLVAGIKSASEEIHNMAKKAIELGTTSDKLAELKLAADLAGVGFEELVAVMAHMQGSIGKALLGGGQGDILRMIGLDPQQLKALDPTSQFQQIAGAIANLGTSAEKAAVTQKLFGRGGLALLPLIKQGSSALDEAAAHASMLGLSVDQVSAEKIAMMHESLVLVKSAFKGLFAQISVQLAPFIAYLADRFVAWGESSGGSVNIVSRAFSRLKSIIMTVLDFVDKIRIVWLQVGSVVLSGIKLVAQGYAWVFKKIREGLEVLASKLDRFQLVIVTLLRAKGGLVAGGLATAIEAVGLKGLVSGAQIAEDFSTGFVDELQGQIDKKKKAISDIIANPLALIFSKKTQEILDEAQQRAKERAVVLPPEAPISLTEMGTAKEAKVPEAALRGSVAAAKSITGFMNRKLVDAMEKVAGLAAEQLDELKGIQGAISKLEQVEVAL